MVQYLELLVRMRVAGTRRRAGRWATTGSGRAELEEILASAGLADGLDGIVGGARDLDLDGPIGALPALEPVAVELRSATVAPLGPTAEVGGAALFAALLGLVEGAELVDVLGRVKGEALAVKREEGRLAAKVRRKE